MRGPASKLVLLCTLAGLMLLLGPTPVPVFTAKAVMEQHSLGSSNDCDLLSSSQRLGV